MNAKKIRSWIIPTIVLLSLLQGCSQGQNQGTGSAKGNESGIADIDMIRNEIASAPTTQENALSRHAALNRWWRLLWRQGYDMSSFDSTAVVLVSERNKYSAAKLEAVTNGYGILEALAANPVYIERIKGTPPSDESSSKQNTRTDWPFYHGIDGAQTGYSPDVGPSEGTLAWRFPKSHRFQESPIIDNGKIYLTSPGVDVIGYCLDEKTGDIEWRARQYGIGFYTTSKATSKPIVTGERVIIETRDRHVFDKKTGNEIDHSVIENYTGTSTEQIVSRALGGFILEDANTGKEIRSYTTEQNLIGQPVLNNGVIFVSCEEGILYAFSTESAEPLWKSELGVAIRGELGMGEGRLYAGSKDGQLFAINPENGKVLWSYQDEEIKGNSYIYYSTPIESNDRLYIGTASSELLCIDNENGKVLWKLKVSDWIRSRPLLLQDVIYAATVSGDMYIIKDLGDSAEVIKNTNLCKHSITADLVGNENGILAAGGDMILYSISPETLELNWKHGILDGVWKDGEFMAAGWTGGLQPTPSVVDGIIYCGGTDGFVHALDSESGEEIWRFETGGYTSAAITVAEGKVFFGQISGEGNYYALDKNTGEIIWQSTEFDNVWVGASYTDNGLFFGNMEGMMYGVNPKDGSILWSYDTAKDTPKENWRNMNKRGHGWPPGIYPVPVADAKKVYIGSWSGYYFAFDQKTGKMVWRTQTNNGNLDGGLPDSAAPMLWKGHVYVQKTGSAILALRTDDGSVAWEWNAPDPFLQNGTLVGHDNKVFASIAHRVTYIPYNATIIAFNDVETGSKELWRYKGGGGLTSPVITNGKLISGSSCDPFVVCLNPDNGSVLWRYFVGGEMLENVPAIYGNKVYVHTNNGWLVAIQ